MSGRQLLVLVGAVIAAGMAWQILWHSPPAWPAYVAVAALCGLAAGIAWERRSTGPLVAENEELKRQAERQTAELQEARKLSGELKSEAAEAIRDSEALYHSLVDHLPLSVLRKDRDGRYTFVNRRYL